MIINGTGLTHRQQERVWAWLVLNGLRWQVPADAKIVIAGRYAIVPCLNIRTVQQTWTLWPKKMPDGWEPSVKVRKIRIRVPFKFSGSWS